MPRKILLIDDDRIQYRLTQAHFEQFRAEKFTLDWAQTYHDGLEKLLQGNYTACLLDFQLGERGDGLALIREAVAAGSHVPIIFLTAETGSDIDSQAMDAGALDYLVKGEINTRALERSLRYALKLGDTLAALRQLATQDALTGLLNRREFDRLLKEEDDRALRFRHAYGVILADLDFFKKINDSHGHPAGDAVLKEVARRLTAAIRSVDRIARFGGEEFAILLTEIDAAGALEAAQRIVAAIADAPITLPDGSLLSITISAGVAIGQPPIRSTAEAVKAADDALYAAKAAGRNRAVAAPVSNN